MADKSIDIDKHPRQTSVVFRMPNKNPDLAKQRKHEWYVRNKDKILRRKRERRAALRKPKPAPTPAQKARTRELNRQACYRYRATHLAQVRYINRVYYHRNRDRIVQQQRDRRAAKKNPFRQLRALADVCSQRLIELDHGYARKREEEEGAGPKQGVATSTAISTAKASGRGRVRGGEGP